MELWRTVEIDEGDIGQPRQGEPTKLAKPDDAVRVGHLSELHLGKGQRARFDRSLEDTFSRWLGDYADAEVDLLVLSGDLVEDPGDLKRLRWVRERLESSGFEWVVVPGNHDVSEPGKPGAFAEVFGEYPRVEEYFGVELVLFDSMAGLPVDARPPADRPSKGSPAYSLGQVGDRQLELADHALGDPPPVCRALVVHHHLRDNAPTAIGREPHPTAPNGVMAPLLDADAVLDWAAARGCRMVFHGHKHRFWEVYQPREGLVAFNTGACTRGKAITEGGRPVRHGRIIDVFEAGQRLAVHELRFAGDAE